jgi:redox-sensitive bicupin YhaK (pirin superfamily)
MEKIRKIKKVTKSQPTLEGAGVHLKRAFGNQQAPKLDPFLLLDDFHSGNPAHYTDGFPWHPHRGIETITYVLEGSVEHGDSLGNEGIIYSGDVQWMTAGSGIVHQEMPKGDKDGKMWGLQLWANLPAAGKMMEPRYRDVTRKLIPEVILENGVRVKVICGTINNVAGPVTGVVIDPEYLDVTIPPETKFSHPVHSGYTVFAYVLEGQGYFEPEIKSGRQDKKNTDSRDSERRELIGSESLVIYDDGEEIKINTVEESVRFLLISGRPIREPVAWYGPIVMNTREELIKAFDEYQQGTFLKHVKK